MYDHVNVMYKHCVSVFLVAEWHVLRMEVCDPTSIDLKGTCTVECAVGSSKKRGGCFPGGSVQGDIHTSVIKHVMSF